ncbi:MAG: hypothetical protein A3F84_26435 [Candidatus Handelsmanbacteria bacterium RIFCSPLOWO2_12_FULL_64_10]|uniref:NADP-dependent oxidoreductase domain-containing protein n=1 Tax=Handelsmanbacteria sp. (strain RIFCSPLOWO2_12_FULL_64_10) TaxID=1817868 RepID=A0A1F6C8I9_HANXR|nr:MAG: hypothetical protein A3F84_26435 [Candidatus Handelsmanbacteria bacterium RIFCSPLOWO2_12_FULL_64_10]
MEKDEGKWTRREFMARSGAVGAGLALGGLPGEAWAAESGPAMPRRQLGRTGMRVSVLGVGGTVPTSPLMLNRAFDLGVNFIDTAEGYGNGNSERSIGEALERRGNRKEVAVVTKTGNYDPKTLGHNLRGSLERLRTDYVDAYYIHNLNGPDRLDDELKGAVERLKRSKKVRFFGFSVHHPKQVACVEAAAACGFVDVIMFKYNFRDYDNAALNRAMDACAKAKVGLVAMKTQGGAVLHAERQAEFQKAGLNVFQATLKAVWADERISTVASAMRNVQQVEENAAAAAQRLGGLEREMLRGYAGATDHLYCRGCGQVCGAACGGSASIHDLLRLKMYHDDYGDREVARGLFAGLPPAARDLTGVDLGAAEAACPHGLAVEAMVREAVRKLA